MYERHDVLDASKTAGPESRPEHVGIASRGATPRGGRGEAARTHPTSVSRVGHDRRSVTLHPSSPRPPCRVKSASADAGAGEAERPAWGQFISHLLPLARPLLESRPTRPRFRLAELRPSESALSKPTPFRSLAPPTSSLISFTRPAPTCSVPIGSLRSRALSLLKRDFADVTFSLFEKAF